MDLSKMAENVRIPNQHDKVYNEECLFSFDSPDSAEGLFVCMEKFVGLGRDHVEQYHRRTGNGIFLHIKRRKVPLREADKEKQQEEEDKKEEIPEKVSKMAIGVPGGFDVAMKKKYECEYSYQVAVLPQFNFYPIDSSELPLSVKLSAKGIMKAESALKVARLEMESATWEGEEILPSKHADGLAQLDNGRKIPPKGWKCERCDLTSNLWMNLTDGAILCGRRFFDGSGGNNHAVDHYKETKYPLAVKLGTITPDGQADVFSYAEDNMVKDPHLVKHLAHFGINVAVMKKTDKSMAELEIDLNQQHEFSAITESGSALEPAFGKGLTGMENLGNTCYMNSVVQILFALPSFQRAYVEAAPAVFQKANFSDPLNDFRLQMCKLGHSLWSGKYSKPATEEEKKLEGDSFRQSIRPQAFRTMVGHGHKEFSTNRQQDAQEFFLHLCNLIERSHVGEMAPIECLQFEAEDKIECTESGKVKYKTRVEDLIPFPIPMEAATNKEEVAAYEKKKEEATDAKGGIKLPDEQVVLPKIPFVACVEAFLAEEEVPNWYSTATKTRTVARKRCRLRTFPDFLVIQLKKFDYGRDWQPVKLDVEVLMPEELDLSGLRGSGMQDGEEELPDEEPERAEEKEPRLEPDAGIVEQLTAMGFDVNGCKRAAVNTKNAGVEAAMNWVLAHSEDADFAEPFQAAGGGTKVAAPSFTPNQEHLATLVSMGITEAKCKKALRKTDNNLERAIDWIFSHPEDDGTEDSADGSSGSGAQQQHQQSRQLSDGDPLYELAGFVSHIGTTVHVGHYVCHLRKNDGGWIIFNDDKVAKSEKPPKTMGYLYLYKRKGLKTAL